MRAAVVDASAYLLRVEWTRYMAMLVPHLSCVMPRPRAFSVTLGSSIVPLSYQVLPCYHPRPTTNARNWLPSYPFPAVAAVASCLVTTIALAAFGPFDRGAVTAFGPLHVVQSAALRNARVEHVTRCLNLHSLSRGTHVRGASDCSDCTNRRAAAIHSPTACWSNMPHMLASPCHCPHAPIARRLVVPLAAANAHTARHIAGHIYGQICCDAGQA
jgi:hypothetical protein